MRLTIPGFLCAALLPLTNAPATEWSVASGELTFIAVQQGAEFEGEFMSFTSDIDFDPEDPAQGKISAVIDMASTNTQNAERDEYLLGPDFFAVETFAEARFETETVSANPNGGFVGQGQLSLRNFSKPVSLNFDFKINDNGAVLTGEAEVLRLDFGVGQGLWTNTEWLGNEVKIRVKLDLVSAPPDPS